MNAEKARIFSCIFRSRRCRLHGAQCRPFKGGLIRLMCIALRAQAREHGDQHIPIPPDVHPRVDKLMQPEGIQNLLAAFHNNYRILSHVMCYRNRTKDGAAVT